MPIAILEGINPIDYAQDLQLGLIGEADLVRRINLAFEALRLLGLEAVSQQLYGRRVMIESRLAIGRRPPEAADKAEMVIFGQVAVEGVFNDFDYV